MQKIVDLQNWEPKHYHELMNDIKKKSVRVKVKKVTKKEKE